MRLVQRLATTLIGLVPVVAAGQFVKGNEAVTTSPTGARTVQTPAVPATGPARASKPCRAADGCHAGAWVMVETDRGLVECTEAYAREGTCRESTYGKSKLLRVWLVKRAGVWLQCQLPDIGSKCGDLTARPPSNLPSPAVQ